jgi:Ala-tRNA(Pro) deacylase
MEGDLFPATKRESHQSRERGVELCNENGRSIDMIKGVPGMPFLEEILGEAGKCIILMVKLGKKVTRYILAVVPGDARVDLPTVKALMQGTSIAFASAEIAERLAGSVTGTILPFSFNSELDRGHRRSFLARKRGDLLQRGTPGSLNGVKNT